MIAGRLLRRVSPHARLVIGEWLFDLSLIGCPLSVWLTDEPPTILILSWLAVTFTAMDIVQTADVRNEQDS